MADGGDHLRITWDAYHRAIEELAVLVHDSGWRFDQVLALARGGLRVGDIFSRVFDVPLAILSTSSYRKEAGTERGALNIAPFVTMPVGTLAGKVLVVDDLVDSGVTLGNVQLHLQENFPNVTEVKSAVIWYKACSTVRPDFYLEYLAENPWVEQPFEVYDGLGIEALKERLKK